MAAKAQGAIKIIFEEKNTQQAIFRSVILMKVQA
jgi:hypothetical protein